MLKKNTEIKLEIDEETGAWRAMSPDYEGWSASGSESFGAAEVASRDLEEWVNSRTCPICGRRYSAPPATSRVNEADICPVCGVAEAVEFLGEKGREIIETVEKAEIAAGRVEPMGCR